MKNLSFIINTINFVRLTEVLLFWARQGIGLVYIRLYEMPLVVEC